MTKGLRYSVSDKHMTTIVQTTSKGQVTLPATWRKRFRTNYFLLKERGGSLIISPVKRAAQKKETWETIFDAKRDHASKGISIDKLIKILEKTV